MTPMALWYIFDAVGILGLAFDFYLNLTHAEGLEKWLPQEALFVSM